MKNKAVMFLFVLLMILPNLIRAEADRYESKNVLLEDLTHFANVGYGLVTLPLSFKCKDWLNMGMYSAGTAILFTADKKVKSFSIRHHTDLNDNIFSFDSYLGNKYSLVLSLGFYGYGYLFKHDKIRKTGLYITEAFIYSGSITSLIKGIIGRERPYKQDNNVSFKPFQFTNDNFFSLPSGHATISFAVSTIIAKSFDNIFWKIFWYADAGMVAASRIYHNKHWLSDVFLGAVIGYNVANYIVNFDDNKKLFAYQIHFGYKSLNLEIDF